VPLYGDIRSAVQVLARLVTNAQHSPAGVPDLPPTAGGEPVREGYFQARELIASAGIPFVEARPVIDVAEARRAAAAIGYPVVLKALGSVHKSDAGGVRAGIVDEVALEAALADMATRLQPTGFSVERMAAAGDGVELLIGVRRDPSFGPVLLVGLGGVYAVTLRDVAAALAQVSRESAEGMIRSLRAAPLLLGARGGAPLDVGAAAAVAAVLSRLVSERDDIAEAEINPLLVGRKGATALDARIVLKIAS
jgi:acyl-CoA synthetase (NDP forming)